MRQMMGSFFTYLEEKKMPRLQHVGVALTFSNDVKNEQQPPSRTKKKYMQEKKLNNQRRLPMGVFFIAGVSPPSP